MKIPAQTRPNWRPGRTPVFGSVTRRSFIRRQPQRRRPALRLSVSAGPDSLENANARCSSMRRSGGTCFRQSRSSACDQRLARAADDAENDLHRATPTLLHDDADRSRDSKRALSGFLRSRCSTGSSRPRLRSRRRRCGIPPNAVTAAAMGRVIADDFIRHRDETLADHAASRRPIPTS